jgi:hypothetical protein
MKSRINTFLPICFVHVFLQSSFYVGPFCLHCISVYGTRGDAIRPATSSTAISNPIQQFPNCDCIVLTSSSFTMKIIICFFCYIIVCVAARVCVRCMCTKSLKIACIRSMDAIVCKAPMTLMMTTIFRFALVPPPPRGLFSYKIFLLAFSFFYKSELYGLIQISYCNA